MNVIMLPPVALVIINETDRAMMLGMPSYVPPKPLLKALFILIEKYILYFNSFRFILDESK